MNPNPTESLKTVDPTSDTLTLLTYKEAAAMLRVCERTVLTLVNTRKALPVVKIGCRRLITKGALMAFIQKSQEVVADALTGTSDHLSNVTA